MNELTLLGFAGAIVSAFIAIYAAKKFTYGQKDAPTVASIFLLSLCGLTTERLALRIVFFLVAAFIVATFIAIKLRKNKKRYIVTQDENYKKGVKMYTKWAKTYFWTLAMLAFVLSLIQLSFKIEVTIAMYCTLGLMLIFSSIDSIANGAKGSDRIPCSILWTIVGLLWFIPAVLYAEKNYFLVILLISISCIIISMILLTRDLRASFKRTRCSKTSYIYKRPLRKLLIQSYALGLATIIALCAAFFLR